MSIRSPVRFATIAAIELSFCALLPSSRTGAAPALFTQPAYESPVRGDPDDLLLIAGDGLSAADTVVYEAAANTTRLPARPTSVPMHSTAVLGVADLVSVAGAPHSLTVHLPGKMTPGQSYVLWVVGPGSQWSAPLLINDARPLWITPDTAYESASLANLPRSLKVVGRNLQPTSAATKVRLIGRKTQTTYTLTANNTNITPGNTTKALERYAAVVDLPSQLVVDKYSVQLSRDGRSWVALLGNGQGPAQVFTVQANPAPPRTFYVSDFAQAADSPCLPNDNIDDTKCILLAIRAAAATPGGATVVFGSGVWKMSNPGQWQSGSNFSDILGRPSGCLLNEAHTCGVTFDGLLVPPGVNLRGAGSDESNTTIIERGTDWAKKGASGTVDGALPSFALLGNNEVSRLVFKDDNDYRVTSAGGPMLQLGLVWYRARLYSTTDPLEVSNVVISKNQFDKPYVAVGNGGLPTDHVYITHNTFGGAYRTAILLVQDTNEVNNLQVGAALPYQTYHFNDAVTDYNIFYPGSWNYTASSGTYGDGTIATQINTGLRTDFSNNVADGTSTRYLYSPTTDVKGWRAGYFWSTGANQEMTLVSSNAVLCPGDKNGDGEAFAYDGSVTLGGLTMAETVISAAPWRDSKGIGGTTLTLPESLVTVLNNYRRVSIAANPTLYYRGFWVEIVAGTGKGQWRKMESVALSAGATPTVVLNVAPAFDVLPDATSKVTISHAYWQNATVSNTVEQRGPPCTKANNRSSGGAILWYDSTADSAIDGNTLYDSGGVSLRENYSPPRQSTTFSPASVAVQSTNEIRDNLIAGVYSESTSGSTGGGIQIGYGAADYYCTGKACVPAPIPPDLGFAISIAGNRLVEADSKDPMDSNFWPMGAITLNRNWSTGPLDASGLNQWQLSDATLIFHNSLQNISNAVPGAMSFGVPRVGIGIGPLEHGKAYSMNSWRSTLYANTCTTVDIPVSEMAIGTVRFCPLGSSDTCECRGFRAVDIGVSVSASGPAIKVGDTVTYVATVTNHDMSLLAKGVILTLEPSAGIQLSSISIGSGPGSCDSSTNVCLVGIMTHGQSTSVRVTATAVLPGTWNTTFSVTHQEPDPNVSNDGVTMSTIVAQ